MDGIERVMEGYENAKDASEYAEALVLDDELIEGTDYRIIWTNEYDGSYPPTKK